MNVVRLSFPHSAYQEIIKAYCPRKKRVTTKDFQQIFGVPLKKCGMHSFVLKIGHIRGSAPGAMLVTYTILEELRGLGQDIVSITRGNSPAKFLALHNMEIHCESVSPLVAIFSENTSCRQAKQITEGILNEYHTGKGGFRGRKYQLFVITSVRQPSKSNLKARPTPQVDPTKTIPNTQIDIPTKPLPNPQSKIPPQKPPPLIEKIIDQMFEEAVLEHSKEKDPKDSPVSGTPPEPQETQEDSESLEPQDPEANLSICLFFPSFPPFPLPLFPLSLHCSPSLDYTGSWSGLQESLSGDDLKEFQQFESTYQELQSLLGELKEKQKVNANPEQKKPPTKTTTKKKTPSKPSKPKKRKQRPLAPPTEEPPPKKPQRIRRRSSFVCRLPVD